MLLRSIFKKGNKFHFVKMVKTNSGITFSSMLDTAKEASFEWSHQRISTTDSKVRTIHSKYTVPRKRSAEEVHFNGHTVGFHPQTQKLELYTK